jgi:hypothetical protein
VATPEKLNCPASIPGPGSILQQSGLALIRPTGYLLGIHPSVTPQLPSVPPADPVDSAPGSGDNTFRVHSRLLYASAFTVVGLLPGPPGHRHQPSLASAKFRAEKYHPTPQGCYGWQSRRPGMNEPAAGRLPAPLRPERGLRPPWQRKDLARGHRGGSDGA